MHKLIQKIIVNKTRCIFVSPHPDDAVFSAGGLMSYLAGKVPVTVINVFSRSGDSGSTVSARAFLRQCGENTPRSLYLRRRAEDKKVLSELNIHPVNLNHVDALWRKNVSPRLLSKILGSIFPEFVSLYPTYRFHVKSGKICQQDRKLVARIAGQIKKYLPADGNYVIFCPAGVGNHVDHLITRSACQSVSPDIYYWSDYPYTLKKNLDSLSPGLILAGDFVSVSELHSRLRLSKLYRSQFRQVATDPKTLLMPEKYYIQSSK
jgi:LmbE family N-acetylglucosaminyl deacetylase